MPRFTPSAPHTEEPAPGLYDHMGVYAPFVWLADWVMVCVMGLGIRAGLVSGDFLRPAAPEASPYMFRRNRQLRRAMASCLRRARRCAAKHGKVNPEDYTPRAYAHLAYIEIMDKTISPRQFFERLIRDENHSRVKVYGMDSAHEITGFVESAGTLMSSVFSNLLGTPTSSPAILSDPAPP